ncbi:MAG TPA: class II fructose-bisphosphate aldolase [Syntrophorhabdaceae bacterium]|nr:class II fructose-bisphosphate aldolase [Syntrophorhabdaceae bacterium]HQM82742.1 class II fructose-bisphosphate aldolase [Syntrophorhabdaceae bacterium]
MAGVKIKEILEVVDNSLEVKEGKVRVKDPARFREKVQKLAEVSAFESGEKQKLARYLTRAAALDLGIVPSSIHDLYIARGRGEVPPVFTVPAINLRALSFDAARVIFRTAKGMDAAAFIFEIARSEIGYTNQHPTEYATSILAAAIAEDYKGPVFIQGDHFQISAKRYGANPDAEVQAVKDLIKESLAAGFFNIDVDTSTMVDLSKPTISEQQELNTGLSAELTAYIRKAEPKGVTVSVGGEIGEVGGRNSTEEELRAYIEGFRKELDKRGAGMTGLSKISIQTGTSHGGVVLPDGSIAKVKVDFDTLHRLSQVARRDYGMGGAVQHGASTLPEDAFGKFVEIETCEIHLATNFMNMFFDRIPADLREEMYAYLREKHSSEKKGDMTDEQFYYKVRKNAVGPFKAQSWNVPPSVKEAIKKDWESQFKKLFDLLGMKGTRQYVEKFIKPVVIQPNLKDYLGEEAGVENVSDLAD